MLSNKQFFITSILVAIIINVISCIAVIAINMIYVSYNAFHASFVLLAIAGVWAAIIHIVLEYVFFFKMNGVRFANCREKIKLSNYHFIILCVMWVTLIIVPYVFGDYAPVVASYISGKESDYKYSFVTWALSNAIFLRNFFLAYGLVLKEISGDSVSIE